MSYESVLKEAKDRMAKALAHTQDTLKGIRTGRASAALVEHVRVDYYGTPTPLSQMAQVSVPEARQLVTIGFLGSFTTFSTFSYESLAMLRDGAWWRAGGYTAGSVVLGLAAVAVGGALATALTQHGRP